MNKFGKQSLARLEGVDPRLRALAFEVLEVHDCSIIYGLRTVAEQRQLVAEGLSKTMNSKHLTGRAIDIAPYPIDWEDTNQFMFFAGHMMMAAKMLGIRIRWGGDWDGDNDLDDQTFMDLVHFEVLE